MICLTLSFLTSARAILALRALIGASEFISCAGRMLAVLEHTESNSWCTVMFSEDFINFFFFFFFWGGGGGGGGLLSSSQLEKIHVMIFPGQD